ncbi:MAG: SDR family NAD(P)-dependent oxidoreductase [Kiritimatiellae bacterium]|nr:SDR family NAD(P)-dependent oxidoreductase [Kiritimatiellia bacterium]
MPRNVLVTGAAVRLGSEIAECLAGAGWGVVIHANRSTAAAAELCRSLRAEGREVWTVQGDLEVADGPDAVWRQALEEAGQIDALVNNAAVFERQPLRSAAAADFERMWRINALAPIRLTALLAAHLEARGAGGAVVNLLDQRVAHADAGAVPYLLSKKYLEAFTLSAALEFGGLLRVNAVAPGAVLRPTGPEGSEPAGLFPTGARPSCAHVAEAARYLLEAVSVTGQVLYVDGGQHLV